MDSTKKSVVIICVLIISWCAILNGYTRKVSKRNFERGTCPMKCRLDPNTRLCMQAQWLPDEEVTVDNICMRFLQQRFNSISGCTTNCGICEPVRMMSKCTIRELEKRFSICHQKPEPGPCGARFVLWKYDSMAGACNTFQYGGCGGNDNRFNSELECLLRCGLLGLANETQNLAFLNRSMEHIEL